MMCQCYNCNKCSTNEGAVLKKSLLKKVKDMPYHKPPEKCTLKP